MSTEPLISISGLEVHFGQSHILQGVDLEAHDKPVSIVGRNGMGKTTLCQTLMGLAPSSGGSIRFQGQELIGKKSHEITKLGIGYVPQGRRVYPSLNVEEHLRVGGKYTEYRASGTGQLSGFTTFSHNFMTAVGPAGRNFQAASSRCWQSQGLC